MSRKILFIVLGFYLVSGCGQKQAKDRLSIPDIQPIESADRLLILAPHPDDDILGCAGVVQEAVAKGAQVKVVYLTNGDHNQVAFIVYEKRLTVRKNEFIHMGEIRRKEAVAAMKILGLDENSLIFLGYPDFGTFAIFSRYWQAKAPYKSMLTRISQVPYKNNLSFGAPYVAESILADLKKVLLDYKPNKIFVTHPADTNVDHKAFYLFLEVALHDLAQELGRPRVYPYLIHHVGWPLPRRYHPELELAPPGQFLDSQVEWSKFELSPQRRQKKYQALLCHKSQTSSSAFYLFSFVRRNELFGDYPDINFRKEDSLKQRVASYLGLSNMFVDSSPGSAVETSRQVSQTKGRVSWGVLDDCLLIRIDKNQELNRRFSTQLYLFGYNKNVPFARMPKVRILTKYKKFRVFDGRKLVDGAEIGLELNKNELVLKVPLRLLGEPDFVLSAVKTYNNPMHVDITSFRRINIE